MIKMDAIKETVNEISHVFFVHAMESSALNSAIRVEEKTLDKDSLTSEEVDEAQRRIDALKNKRKSINAWKRLSLFGDRETQGLYSRLGLGEALYNIYTDAVSSRDYSAWNEAIKMVVTSWGYNLNNKLVKKLAQALSHAAGLKLASMKEIKAGGRLTKAETSKKFTELLALAIRDYMLDTEQISVPNNTLYTVTVVYDEGCHVIDTLLNSQSESETEAESVSVSDSDSEIDSDFNSLSVKELKTELKGLGVTGYSKMSKPQLVELLVATLEK